MVRIRTSYERSSPLEIYTVSISLGREDWYAGTDHLSLTLHLGAIQRSKTSNQITRHKPQNNVPAISVPHLTIPRAQYVKGGLASVTRPVSIAFPSSDTAVIAASQF